MTQKTLEPFPEAFELSEDMNGYDLTAWLRWMVMRHGREISDADIGRCLELTDKIYENPRVEDYKPYEKILQYELGTSEQQAHARKQLERAGHITELQAGIMGILAMRTAYILRDYAKLEAVRGKVHVSLQWLADELAKEPEKIPFRCPY